MMRKVLETAVILLGTLGWWGFVYPDLCLLETANEETYSEESVYEEDSCREAEGSEQKDLFFGSKEEKGIRLPKTSGTELVITVPVTEGNKDEENKEIRIKSKIAEYVYQIRNRQEEKEIRDGK